MTKQGYCFGDEKDHPDFKSIFRYEESTGKFFWIKNTPPRGKAGEEAGSLNSYGRRYITYQKRHWYASRLAWYYVYGVFPNGHIDHINGNNRDDRISNLREVTARGNMQNLKIHRTGRLVGAHKRKNNRWSSHIKIGHKIVNLGTFDSEKEASDKYWEYVSSLKEPITKEKS